MSMFDYGSKLLAWISFRSVNFNRIFKNKLMTFVRIKIKGKLKIVAATSNQL